MTWLVYTWLLDRWDTFAENFQPLRDSLDILVVAYCVYWLLMRIKGTRAAQMALGLLILVLAWRLSDLLELATVSFLLDNFLSSGLLILIVIFQADVRRALTRVGRGLFTPARMQEAHTIEEIVRACQALAQRRVGALVAIERDVQIDEFVEQGTALDAELSRDLLISLFLPYSPLHDGAVVVRRGRIASAGCILPLAMRGNVPGAVGTRHRAAIGITEETDALVVVVSEETGKISLVAGGEIREDLDGPHLRQALLELTGSARSPEKPSDSDVVADPARAAETEADMQIFDNLLYKVVALLIACVLWAAAQGVTDVEQSFDIPVQVEKVPESLVVIEESAHEINLRVMGSRAALRQVAKNVQHYAVSFEGAKAGEARLAVNKDQITLPRGARIMASSPSTLVFALESVSTKVVPVRADLTGELPPGYKVARVTIEPKDISITGARSAVRNVREVVTDRLDLSTLRETTTLESPVALGYPHVWRKDQSGEPIRIKIEIESESRPSAGG